VVDDEPLLRERLIAHLAPLWPELEIVGQARNGREALELFETTEAADRLPRRAHAGLDGIAAAREIGSRRRSSSSRRTSSTRCRPSTAGAIDYLVKPFEPERLAQTVERLKQRGQGAAGALDHVLDELAEALKQRRGAAKLQWVKARWATAVRLIPVDQIIYLRSDEKYTLSVWTGGEALIRKTIRELSDELDTEVFVQVHRSVIVNLHHVAQVTRGLNETADVAPARPHRDAAGEPELPGGLQADVKQCRHPGESRDHGQRCAALVRGSRLSPG
jgi:DNA-binding LytR/AlgR family response regulator